MSGQKFRSIEQMNELFYDWALGSRQRHGFDSRTGRQSYQSFTKSLFSRRKAINHLLYPAVLSQFCTLLFKDSLESKPMTVSKCRLFTKAAIAGRFRMRSSLHLSQFS